MEYKVESSLWDFPAWSGGKDTLDTLKEKGDVDAEDADEWFSELSLEKLEEISGYKRDEYRDPDAMIDEGDFVDAVQEWWDGLDDYTRVEIYKRSK